MRNIKNTFLVSALSLGLVVGAVGIASAATTTNYQQKIANWIKNDPNPMVMNMNTTATPAATPATTPATTPAATPATTPATTPAATPRATTSTKQAPQYNSNHKTQQRSTQQTAPKQPTQNYNNGYDGHNGYDDHWNGNRMSGNWSGDMDW